MPTGNRPTVLVMGGGVVGVTQAYVLLKRGYDVTLIERGGAVGDFTSKANAGLLSAGCSQPWNAPGVPLTVLKTLTKADAPYLFRLSAFPGVIPWGLRFLAHCRTVSYDRASRASLELALYSLDCLRSIADDEDLAFDRQRNGVLKYFEDEGAYRKEKVNMDAFRSMGLRFRSIDRDELIALEPTLEPHFDRIAGGIHFFDDESGDACRFTKGLAERCEALGAKFLLNTTVEDIRSSNGAISGVVTDRGVFSADQYILSLGPNSGEIARRLRLDVPIYPVKGYSVTIETNGEIPLPGVPFIDWGRKVAVTAFGTRIRAAGTAEFCGHNVVLTDSRLRGLRASLMELFPRLNMSMKVQDWAGLRPVTPDGLPILGASPFDNLFFNTGHGPHGWGLSCGSAQIVADLMAGIQPGIDTAAFGYKRP